MTFDLIRLVLAMIAIAAVAMWAFDVGRRSNMVLVLHGARAADVAKVEPEEESNNV